MEEKYYLNWRCFDTLTLRGIGWCTRGPRRLILGRAGRVKVTRRWRSLNSGKRKNAKFRQNRHVVCPSFPDRKPVGLFLIYALCRITLSMGFKFKIGTLIYRKVGPENSSQLHRLSDVRAGTVKTVLQTCKFNTLLVLRS